MDIKFSKGPKKINLSEKDFQKLRPAHHMPRDEQFQDLFMRCMKNEGVVLQETLLDIAMIDPFSKDVVVPEVYIDAIKMQIQDGDKPEIFVYKKDERYIMSDDYAAYYAYLSLGWKKIPVSILKPVAK